MRKVSRPSLASEVEADLKGRQERVDAAYSRAGFSAISVWKSARQADALKVIHVALRDMAGDRERCMYCIDSHGTDIEHFWPKTTYPRRMFLWPNLLLCCAECGRFKGDKFPLADGEPLLIDPTADEPWDHLDFDSETGNVTARYDRATNTYSLKGEMTVKILHLSAREALAKGYLATLKRLARAVENFLAGNVHDPPLLVASLREHDDHGLLGWCILGYGQYVEPFVRLKADHPNVWQACDDALRNE